MKKSNFYFLEDEFPQLYEYAVNAEKTFYDEDSNLPNNIRKFLERFCYQSIAFNNIDCSCSKLADYYKLIKKYDIYDSTCINYLYKLKEYTNQSHHDSINNISEIKVNEDNNRVALKNIWVLSQIFYDKFSKERRFILVEDKFELPDFENSKVYKDIKLSENEKEIEKYKSNVKDLEAKNEVLKEKIKEQRNSNINGINDSDVVSDVIDIFMENGNEPLKAKYIASCLKFKYPSIDKHFITKEIFYGNVWSMYFTRVNDDGEYIISLDFISND